MNSFSQPGRKAVPGDLFSEAVFSELGWTSGTQLKGEGETTCTGEHLKESRKDFEISINNILNIGKNKVEKQS